MYARLTKGDEGLFHRDAETRNYIFGASPLARCQLDDWCGIYSRDPEKGIPTPAKISDNGEMEHEKETTRFIAAWMQVRQLIQSANFNRFQQAGLSATQFMTLNVIPSEGMTLSELARRLNLSAATLNETVNSLEDRGLVQRTRQERDARKVDIRATTAGAAMQNSSSEEFHNFMSRLFGRMSKSRRDGLLAGLEQMARLGQDALVAPTLRDADAAPAKRSSRRSPMQ